MNKNSKIYIAGHMGLVGSAIHRQLISKGYNNIIGKTIDEMELTNQARVKEYFKREKPEYVIMAAAKVGGILANNTYRADFIYENLQVQNNLIHQSFIHGVKKLLFLGSSCIYPRDCSQPMKEDYLLTSPLEYTNEPYAVAKIAGIKMCESYNIQYGTNFISVMPTNLYGPGDNFDLEKSHVLPALARKMFLGKCFEDNNWKKIKNDLNRRPIENINGSADRNDIINILEKYGICTDNNNNSGSNTENQKVKVILWGTGNPKREFLYSDDLADACVFLMENVEFKNLADSALKTNPEEELRNCHINIGTGEEISIKELALMIKEITGFGGELVWDESKPDGTMLKRLDVSKLENFGWTYKTELKEGIKKSIEFNLD